MTQDFIEDFIQTLEKEGLSYILVVAHKDKETALTAGVRTHFNITDWRTIPSIPVRSDIIDVLDETVFQQKAFTDQCRHIQKQKNQKESE